MYEPFSNGLAVGLFLLACVYLPVMLYYVIIAALTKVIDRSVLPLVALKEHQAPAVLHVREEKKEERAPRRREALPKDQVEQLYEELQRAH